MSFTTKTRFDAHHIPVHTGAPSPMAGFTINPLPPKRPRREMPLRPRLGYCAYFQAASFTYCGAVCDGGRCDAHPQKVALSFNIGGKGGRAV